MSFFGSIGRGIVQDLGSGLLTRLGNSAPGWGSLFGNILGAASSFIPGMNEENGITGIMRGSRPEDPRRGLIRAGVNALYPSDRRLKENVKPIKNAVATVKRLNGVTYGWKANLGMGMPQGQIIGMDRKKKPSKGTRA